MVEFADLLHFALPFLVVVQPTLNHLSLFGPNTELPVLSARIGYRQNPDPVPFTRLTPSTAFPVKDCPLDQRSPQDFFRGGQGRRDLPAPLDSFLLLHLQR